MIEESYDSENDMSYTADSPLHLPPANIYPKNRDSSHVRRTFKYKLILRKISMISNPNKVEEIIEEESFVIIEPIAEPVHFAIFNSGGVAAQWQIM